MKRTKFIIGVISLLMIGSSQAADICSKITQSIKHNHSDDILAIINFNTKQSMLYSNTVYHSTDRQHYIKEFSVNDPDVIKSATGFCAILPAGELKPGLAALKIKSCSCAKAQCCQETTFNLTWDAAQKKYTKASPSVVTIHF